MQKNNVEKQNYDAPRVERIALDEQSFLATSPTVNIGASVGDFGDGGEEDIDGDSYDADGNPLDGNNP
jgi:hypothetical protein